MNKALLACAKFLTLPMKQTIEKEIDRQVQLRAKLSPMDNTMPEDIFIAGYPRSGNTWMQNLVAGMVYGMDMRLIPDKLVQEIVPDVHQSKYYRRYTTPTFFKTHHLPRPQYRRVIHLVRDGRDVMVSYFHYASARWGRTDDLLSIINDDEIFPAQWHEHTQ